ncbi:MAG: sacsin N-terminal ATP-binding-like domain-containing protein, partial [Gammaproteobacteria bacterium]
MPSYYEIFVNDIANAYDKDERATRSLANDITSGIEQDLSGAKYVNELLQNADDAGRNINHPIAVEIILTEHFLLFKHNGGHFDDGDVDGISDCASTNRKKLDDLEAIGHKGRGFKAVFSISNYVLIVCKNWSFRFDKANWNGVRPWQLMPAWTNVADYPAEIAPFINVEQVCFAIRLDKVNRSEVLSHIIGYRHDPKLMIFLKRTNSLSLTDTVSNEQFQITYDKQNLQQNNDTRIETIQAKYNELNIASWYVYTINCKVPAVMQEKLKNQENIPKKYKEIDSIPVTLAYEIKNNEMTNVAHPAIACYLFTEIDLGMQSIINAEFFLESSRAQFQGNDCGITWNA